MSCKFCGKVFTTAYNLKRHLNIHTSELIFNCSTCGKNYSQKSVLKRHNCKPINSIKPAKKVKIDVVQKKIKSKYCKICKKDFALENFSQHQKSLEHKENFLKDYKNEDCIEVLDCAFQYRIINFRVYDNVNTFNNYNCSEFLYAIKDKTIKLIVKQLAIHTAVKIIFELFAEYILPEKDEERNIKSFALKNRILTQGK